jgi:hypothetical protein
MFKINFINDTVKTVDCNDFYTHNDGYVVFFQQDDASVNTNEILTVYTDKVLWIEKVVPNKLDFSKLSSEELETFNALYEKALLNTEQE